MTDRVFNFSSGPAVLPLAVLEQVQRELLSLPGVGMSILEISHRSKPFDAILAEATQGIRDLLGVPEVITFCSCKGAPACSSTCWQPTCSAAAGKRPITF